MSDKEKLADIESVIANDGVIPTAPPEGEKSGDEAPAGDLAKQLADANSRADENWNQLLRLQAEMENVRRRAARDVEAAHKFALDKFANELLPVRDSLEMGVMAAAGDNEQITRLREGVVLTLKQLTDVMEKFGIREVNPLQQPFNPDLHQAIGMQPSDSVAANHVMGVMQKGYTLNDRLLRPAMVMVSRGSDSEAKPQLDTHA
jgi:molecular chaperone GrpE